MVQLDNETNLRLIHWALDEDLGERGDITTNALDRGEGLSHAQILAKQDGVICGVGIAKQVFLKVDSTTVYSPLQQDGDRVQKGQPICDIKGPAKSILTAERTALNFLGRLSGIATLTFHFVEKIKGTSAAILDTRKTTPGWRQLEKYAVTCGGGQNHRLGLYDMFLIKENHIKSAGGISTAVQQCRAFMQKHGFECPIEVEAQNETQVKEALQLEVDRIMLDNMSPRQMSACVRLVANGIPLEASGNVSLATVRKIAETGVDYISVGSLTHSAATFDLSLLFL